MVFDSTIKVTDLAIVFATLVGPILAVQAQVALEKRRGVRAARMAIFKRLMATRAQRLSPGYVEAFNAVPVEFTGRGGALKGIRSAWKLQLQHFNSFPAEQHAAAAWESKRADLFVDMLSKMGAYLGYDFEEHELVSDFYHPTGMVTTIADQEKVLHGLARILSGESAFPMELKSIVGNQIVDAEQAEVRKRLLALLGGESALKVQNAAQPPPMAGS